jgi:hypothetical protein
MCARPKIDEETNVSTVQQNENQSGGLRKPKRLGMQIQADTKNHVITTQEVCALPEANSAFYRDILAVVTEKQRVLVWAVYDCFEKWQQSKSYK